LPLLACGGARQSRGRVCAGARVQRSALRADSPALLDRMARVETRSAHCVRCARTIDASQMLKRALRARGHALCGAQRRTMSLPTHTRPRLCRHHRGIHRCAPRASQRGGRYPGWATCGAARSARGQGGEPGRARVPADSCSPGEPARHAGRAVGPARAGPARSHEAAARERRLRAASQPPLSSEHRSEVGAQRRPRQQEPTPDTARRAAPFPHQPRSRGFTAK